MGWKSLKAHYGIRHTLAFFEGEGWCIGSAYVHALIAIDPSTRTITPSSLVRDGDELSALIQRFRADGDAFWAMWATPDVFDRAIPVFSTREGALVESLCEEPGWPNTTHDGRMMYDNRHFPTAAAAIADGLRDAASSIAHVEGRLVEWEADGARLRARLAECRGHLSGLEQEARFLREKESGDPGHGHPHAAQEATP